MLILLARQISRKVNVTQTVSVPAKFDRVGNSLSGSVSIGILAVFTGYRVLPRVLLCLAENMGGVSCTQSKAYWIRMGKLLF